MPGFELIGKEEQQSVNDVFEKGGGILFAHGFEGLRNGMYQVRDFEKEFAEKLNVKHAQALTSGTAAIKVALKALGVGPGDEVITQAFNFIAVVEAILDVGATPIIANVDDSLNMDPAELRERINDKTKAILLVHMLGFSANLDEVLSIGKEKSIPVIEDNCEALGATWNGASLGTQADIGIFSFDMGKTITCGEGGMLVTNNEKHYKFAREYSDHGHENNPKLPRGRDSRTIYGFNYRMSELQAAVGRAQLKKLDYIVEENRKRFNILSEILIDQNQRKLFKECNPLGDTFMFKIEDANKRKEVLNYLTNGGGGTKNVPDAIEWHCTGYWDHCLSKEEVERSQKTKNLLDQYVAMPIALGVSLDEYKNRANKIKEIMAN